MMLRGLGDERRRGRGRLDEFTVSRQKGRNRKGGERSRQ
jgi:hypothetical protein